MRRSTYCIQAEKNASPNNSIEKKLIDLLKQQIQAEQVNELRKRADKLITLFSGLKANQASSLLSRLSDRNDYLGRLFKCELRTDFRDALIEVLKKRVAAADETATPPQKSKTDEVPEESDADPDEQSPEPDEQPSEPDEQPSEPDEQPPEPPEPPDLPGIIIDFDDYFSKLLQWISDSRKATNDPRLLEKLSRLEGLAKTAIALLGTLILVQGIKYYAYSVILGRLVEIGTETLEEEILKRGLYHLDLRIRSRARQSPQFGQLERTLREITRLTDEIEREQSEKRKPADQSKKSRKSRECCAPKAIQLYRGKYTAPVRMDPRLTTLACAIRATMLPDGLSYEAFKKFNIAIAKVDIDGSIQYLHAANLPKSVAGPANFPLHSEGYITEQIYKLKRINAKDNVEVKLLQLYTERIPCPDCKRLLDNLFSEAAVYYTVKKKAPRGMTKAAYLMEQYCVLPPK